MASTGAPNAEQIRYWNDEAARRSVAHHELIDTQIGALGRAAMERAALRPGERVLDVGCGCGDTALELAARVAPSGEVVGLDISGPMLARARERARLAGVGNARFEEADAQTHPLPPMSFDLVYSRFGVMFFTDPVAAFRNLHAALRPEGRLAFVCWQALASNPWMLVPLMAMAQHVPLPALPPPDAPGPFSFADDGRVRRILEAAGFHDIALESRQDHMTIGGAASLDAVVDFLMQLGPLGAALREQPPEVRERVGAAVRDAVRPYTAPAGIRMEGATWIVTARH